MNFRDSQNRKLDDNLGNFQAMKTFVTVHEVELSSEEKLQCGSLFKRHNLY